MDIQDCLDKHYLIKVERDKNLIKKELEESVYDFKKAIKAFKDKDYKWTIIKCYYSMFHSAKAICFRLGYREKRHFALLIVLEELNKEGKLESKFVNDFSAMLSLREGADYRYNYSKERAENSLEIAREFNPEMKQILKKL